MPPPAAFGEVVTTHTSAAAPKVLLVCEHASNRIPAEFGTLGLPPEALDSHIAWDPGALPLALGLAGRLQAALVAGGVSRLVYDCNRPPDAPSAMPARSEARDIPGNQHLSGADRQARIDGVYRPFVAAVAQVIEATPSLRLLVTVHSFTPVFQGTRRAVQIGLLHGGDARFARAMQAAAPKTPLAVCLNQPYSAADGVTHTLDRFGAPNGLLNVMIEVRNDLLASEAAQAEMTGLLAPWISSTLARLEQEAA